MVRIKFMRHAGKKWHASHFVRTKFFEPFVFAALAARGGNGMECGKCGTDSFVSCFVGVVFQ